ncbi:MAG: TraR/DksA C4-type zinc finger protein [Bacillota bacterium]|jgi:YteA family regulatory protein
MKRDVLEHFRQELVARRQASEATLADLETELREAQGESFQELSTYDNHTADIATETWERGKDLALRENQRLLLEEIDAALQRIEDGTYGWCVDCGQPIARERLEAVPHASRCVHCQEEIEDPIRERPIEESLINELYARSFTDGAENENVAFDGEDTWQALARYGTSNTPGDFRQVEDYSDAYIDSDESIGIVWEEEALPASWDRSRGQFLKRGPHLSSEQHPIRQQSQPRVEE